MPSIYQPWCRSDPYDARMANLAKARRSPRYHPPRPWRSSEESRMIRRFVWQWLTCRDRNRPSERLWARQLGVSHTWVQKLVKQLQAEPSEMQREVLRGGDPTLAQLSRARENTRHMRERGELRLSRREKCARFLERQPVKLSEGLGEKETERPGRRPELRLAR
jgi:hypothetical protein